MTVLSFIDRFAGPATLSLLLAGLPVALVGFFAQSF